MHAEAFLKGYMAKESNWKDSATTGALAGGALGAAGMGITEVLREALRNDNTQEPKQYLRALLRGGLSGGAQGALAGGVMGAGWGLASKELDKHNLGPQEVQQLVNSLSGKK